MVLPGKTTASNFVVRQVLPLDNITVTKTTKEGSTVTPNKACTTVSCHREHRLEDLILEDNCAYWGYGFFLENVVCNNCKHTFRNKHPLKSKMEKNPSKVHFCANLMESNGSICDYALCNDCWNLTLLDRAAKDSPGRHKRKRVARKITSL